jgi:diphthamide synthase (EF-2-diphthine--ammonia ligase)
VFGDLYLTEVRAYREQALAGTGLTPLFPLWGRPTEELAVQVIDLGMVATLTCVDLAQLPAQFAGRRYDRALLADLPSGADPCGENGEFHTFVCDAPGFAHAIAVRPGPIVTRDGFCYADLIPADLIPADLIPADPAD